MRIRTCLMAASLCLVAGLTFAQDPRFPTADFRGPALFGPQSFQGAQPIPAVGGGGPVLEQVYVPATGGAIVVPGPGGGMMPILDGAPVPVAGCCNELYSKVCYKNPRKVSPCAVPMVISVLDPCSRKYDCETKCVLVKICIPTCGCPRVKVTRAGRHTRYDYGKYAVDIVSHKNGTITVDYDA